MPDELGVGIVGWGFIGKVHTYGYLNLPLFYRDLPARVRLVGVCTSREATADRARAAGGFEFGTASSREILEHDDIDIVHCCTPNYLHRDFLIEAMKAGKHIYCDKPLALNLQEARDILEASKERPETHQMTFEYRFVPALMRAKQLVEEGLLGRVFSVRACYLHSGYIDPDRPLSWRLDRDKAGGGALFDLGAHVVDIIRHVLGEYEAVFATTPTFITERPVAADSPRRGAVGVDDIAFLQVRLANGAMGTVEASRLATGANDELRLEIHGSQGALAFNLMDPNWLWVYDQRVAGDPIGGRRGYTKVETVQRYPAPAVLPGPKFSIGWMRYHLASQHEFLCRVAAGRPGNPGFEDGYRVQEVLEAAQKSAAESRWVSLEEPRG